MAGELSLDQAVAATQALAQEIVPAQAAADAPLAAPYASTLIMLRRFVDAAGVIIDSYLEGAPNGKRN